MIRGAIIFCVGMSCAAVAALAADAPAVTISLGSRDAKATPFRTGFSHTGGGNIDVQQPSPDTIVVTMSGVAVAGAHPVCDSAAGFDFLLNQEFEVAIADPKIKSAKASVEARVIGLLRSQKHGHAEIAGAHASLSSGSEALVAVELPAHCAGAGRNVSINDKTGPVSKAIAAGTLNLHQQFGISVTHPHSVLPCKAASAEFAPDPALDPLWISYWEPFHGANKKDFGFQVVVKVAPN
jgi:hypothetical protein